jgi:uncharacterized membrane protein required for colicin V production
MSFDKLPINWFDVVVLAVLVAGILHGRKRGMSEELLNVIKWVAVVLGCAVLYEPVGRMLAQSSPFSLLSSYLIVYTVGGLLILGFFALFKHAIGGKLLGSDIFGRAEYYLGMGSGVLRVTCILIAVLALLNSRYFSPTEVRAMERFQDDVYGSNLFPPWHTAQSSVFEKSLVGPWIKQNLSFVLIKPTEPENKQIHQKEAKWQ